MLPVTASEMASIQADLVAAVCDKSCQLYRDLSATTPGIYGSSSSSRDDTSAYTLMHTVVCGMSQPSGGQLANYDYLIGDKNAWTVHFPVGTDVLERDHVLVEGQILEVQILLAPQSYQGLLSVLAVEIK
jgi:hypothetical protein